MEENDNGKDEQEGDRVTDKHMAYRIETVQKKLNHPNPLTRGVQPRPQPTRMPLRQFEARGWQPYFARYGQRRWRRRRRSRAPGSRSESRLRWSPLPDAR